ncbi:MAG: transglutaminase domain-containing protein [Candidatus Pelethousia sp.]|nr:transglutaminase domain-containing protein [Candidatus Pelethousia sp.]
MKRIAALVLCGLLLLSLAVGCQPSQQALLRQGIETQDYDLQKLCEMVETALLAGQTEVQVNYRGRYESVQRAVGEGMEQISGGLRYLGGRFLSGYQIECEEEKGYVPTRILLEVTERSLLGDMPRQSDGRLEIQPYGLVSLESLLMNMMETKQPRALRLYEKDADATLDDFNEMLQQDLNIVMNTNYAYGYLIESAEWVLSDYTGEDGNSMLELDLTLAYLPDTIPLSGIPVINDGIEMVQALVRGWAEGEGKVTLILQDVRPDEETLFDWINTAEVNSSMVACEGDSIWYEVLENPSERQIGRFWLEFAAKDDKIALAQEELERAVEEIAQTLREELSGVADRETAYRAVFNTVLAMTEYDDAIREATEQKKLTEQMQILRSAYGALVHGKTVCTGYARAFQALCSALELPCWTVNGYQKGEGHAWNMVRLDGQTLYVDCTFADTSGRPDRYFLFTGEQLEKRHYEADDGFLMPW